MTYTLTQLSTIVLAVLDLGTAPAFAADYFIDPVSGDDNNSGTSVADAWASPSRGASMRSIGDHSGGDTILNVRDTSGFLSSGSLNVAGIGNVAYDSKTATSFNISGGLSGTLNDNTLIHDGSILGGTGFGSGDTVNLGGGVFINQHIRMKASGVHYKGSAFNGRTMFRNINYSPSPFIGPMGAVWHDGEKGVNTAAGNTLSGVDIKVDNNLGGSLAPIELNNVDNFTMRDVQVRVTGYPSSGTGNNAVRSNFSTGVVVEDSIFSSKYGDGWRQDNSSTTTIRDSIFFDSTSGITAGNGTITADNITIFSGGGQGGAVGSSAAITECCAAGKVTLTDSLIVDHPNHASSGSALNDYGAGSVAEAGDYRVFVSVPSAYGNWTPGANDVELFSTEAADFGFISIDPMRDSDGFVRNNDFLRALRSSAANTSGISGDYLGA